MKLKEEYKQKFAKAMIDMAKALKLETEKCSQLCGVVTEKEVTVIDFVGGRGNVKMSDIADNIDAPMSTITSIIDKLVEKKLINRDHSGEDRRVINVTLSTSGRAAYKKLCTKKDKLAENVLSQLNEKDQELIIKHLDIIVGEMGKT
jgi:DNA-binding MarR family transcriptional regulator